MIKHIQAILDRPLSGAIDPPKSPVKTGTSHLPGPLPTRIRHLPAGGTHSTRPLRVPPCAFRLP